ncbi:crocetin glucosyltransferase, chloroplastic-like [Momordica charantia]|uniref:Mogroside I-E synthase n=1 Tax=Momordica charantia TaxID=3673 RepID=A0A6J1CZE0_MOMCH|nr:crocetin glucosyltransferase, chloroplastic-like [Momordica charantia]
MFRCGGGDGDYMDWLKMKDEGSVVYVSFGSISRLLKQQKEEIARGLLSSGRPFLWVMRDDDVEEDKLSCSEELEGQGKIVKWCSQLDVLSNPATGCFLTHCGWNSCLESLACGVPMVAFPQWSDQGTNAKIVEELMASGVRMDVAMDAMVKEEEVRRCLDLVMGNSEKGEEIRRNANKWKELARKATIEGGSSYHNLKAFVDQLCP